MTLNNMNLLFEKMNIRDNYVEIRILETNHGVLSGYFNDFDALEKCIRRYDGKYNIFFTLNRLDSSVHARSMNRFKEFSKITTSDAEIIRRQWILVDLDSVRPAGVSATDLELARSKEKAEAVKAFLDEQGFPEPVIANSGNGMHLLYKIDMPNEPEILEIIKKFLQALDKKFSDEYVHVDTKNFNAARICKLYGTYACKGENTPERPHRRSEILSLPETWTILGTDKIKEIIKMCGNVKECNKTQKTGTKRKNRDVKEFLERHGIEIYREKPCEGNAICYVLDHCPWNEAHRDHSAFVMQYPNGKVVAKCHHDSCRNENWNTLLKLFPDENFTDGYVKKTSVQNDGMSVAEQLLNEVEKDGHEVFHDSSETEFVSVNENGVREYFSIRDKKYRQYLLHLYYKEFGKTIPKDSLQQVLETLCAKAVFEGREMEVANRCKYMDGKIFYFLADELQTVICIDEKGYHVMTEETPIPFVKQSTMLEQCMPIHTDEDFNAIAERHWHFGTEDARMLHSILLITRFISDCPMPIIYYMGDRGSAKTTSMKFDQMIVAPSVFDIKALPGSKDDLLTSISRHYMVSYDNIDSLNSEQSNICCIACTSGYYPKRRLYTTDEEYDVKLTARLSFSGITNIASRPDLIDRCVGLTLRRIPTAERKTMEEVMGNFKQDIPYLLHGIFIVLSKAIVIHDGLDLKDLPRMADFATWGYAVAEVLGYGGERFLTAYKNNQTEMLGKLLEEEVIANVLVSYLQNVHPHFKGSMTELLVLLTEHAQQLGLNTRSGWIQSVNVLSRKLFQLESVLSLYEVYLARGKSNGQRYVEVWKEEK